MIRLSTWLLSWLLSAACLVCAASAETLRPNGAALVRADTVALLLSGQEGGGIPMSLLALPHPAAGHVTIVLEADGSALIEGFETSALRADVYVYVLGPEKKAVASAAYRIALDLDTTRERLTHSGVRVVFTMSTPAGEHQVRALVRSENGALGLTGTTLTMVVAESAEPRLLPPFFATSQDWITVVSAADEAALSGAWGWLGEKMVAPSSYPVLATGSPRDLVVVAMNTRETPILVLEDTDGTMLEIRIDASDQLSGALSGTSAWRSRLDATSIEPGTYRLSAASGKALSGSIPVLVTAGASGEAVQAWTEVDAGRLAPAAELPPVRAAADPDSASLRDKEIAGGYLSALHALAGGDRKAALRRLYEVETRVLEQIEEKPLELLERLEAEALAALLSETWTALLPVILLHAEAVGGYRAGRRSALVGHNEKMVVRLARTYVERVQTDDARRDAALMLSGIAGELRRLGALGRAEEIYRHALSAEPGNEDLVLAIAAIQERLGHAREAVATLEGSGVKSLGPEARLRLALNLRRTGQGAKAGRILDQLSKERLKKAEAWVTILAVQELAMTAIDRGDAEMALATVNRALARWPDHPALRLQSAYLLDRSGRPEKAAAILEEMGRRASIHLASERVRYNAWPRPAGGARRREMEDRAMARVGELERLFAAAVSDP